MKVSRWAGLLGWACLPGLLFLWSCRRENPSNFDSNLAPETYISGAPTESTLAYYRVHLYWQGADPDGKVDHYEYAVTDSNRVPGELTPGFSGYYRTSATDSIFVLSADQPQILGHRFYVRAVDNEGKLDPTPAWAYFIAHDVNFPYVTFHTAVGRWTDSNGQERSVSIHSNNQYSPTDTIGVGGNVSYTWSGGDVDPGGSVVGFEYRGTTSTGFTGGTLADTAFSASFEPTQSASGPVYFSGNDVLQVRAIDDAGAKTQPDSVRSVVVNFSPVAWIVDPDNPTPTRKRVFIDLDSGVQYPSGTTLAYRSGAPRQIQFEYTGFDDPRDAVADPDNPCGVDGFSFRRLKDGGGPAYVTIAGVCGGINDFKRSESINLTPGKYLFLLRSRDVLDRWGRPDSLALSVNYSPYFKSVFYYDQNGDKQPLWNPSTSGNGGGDVSVSIQQNADGTYPDLHVEFTALDNHYPPPNTDPLDVNNVVEEELSRVDEYRARLNGSRDGFEPVGEGQPGERFYAVDPAGGTGVVHSGVNVLDLTARDVAGSPTTSLTSISITFNVQLVPR